MIKALIFTALCLNVALGYSVGNKQEQCVSVKNMEHPDVPFFRWAFFGNIEAFKSQSQVLKINLQLHYIIYYNSITFDLDDQFQNLALDFSIFNVGKLYYNTFTKKDGKYQQEIFKQPLDLEFGTDYDMEVRLVDNGHAYNIKINGVDLGNFSERSDVPISQVKFISFINNIVVNSIEICDE